MKHFRLIAYILFTGVALLWSAPITHAATEELQGTRATAYLYGQCSGTSVQAVNVTYTYLDTSSNLHSLTYSIGIGHLTSTLNDWSRLGAGSTKSYNPDSVNWYYGMRISVSSSTPSAVFSVRTWQKSGSTDIHVAEAAFSYKDSTDTVYVDDLIIYTNRSDFVNKTIYFSFVFGVTPTPTPEPTPEPTPTLEPYDLALPTTYIDVNSSDVGYLTEINFPLSHGFLLTPFISLYWWILGGFGIASIVIGILSGTLKRFLKG